MKKTIMLLFTTALMSTAVVAQKIAAEKIPDGVSAAFKGKFPDAVNTNWEMENANEYEAGFKLNGKEVSANFDGNGKWLETETEIKVADLPEPVQASLSKDFAGYKIEEACKVQSEKNGNCFEAEVAKGNETFEVLFSADGKMLSKNKEEEKEDIDED